MDLIITKDNKLYLLGINNFFKKYDAQAVINAVDMEFSKLFLAASMFVLRDKFDFINLKDSYFSAFSVDEKKCPYGDEYIIEKYKNSAIACVSATTMNTLTKRIIDVYGEQI